MALNKTSIEWVKNPDGTQGYTWNPITGCLNGCEYCYARRLANTRLRERYLANKNLPDFKPDDIPDNECSQMYIQKCYNDPFYPRFWPEKIKELERGKCGAWCNYYIKKKGIFVCDMSDLFGLGIPQEWQEAVFEIIRNRIEHRFYLLTKQPQNLIQWSPFPDNCWVGVSAMSSDMFDVAFRALMRITAKVKYVSFEPLLDWTRTEGLINPIKHLDWVIIGAQTKPYKPPKIEWVEEIVRACDKAGVAVFLKDNLTPLLNKEAWGNTRLWGNSTGKPRQEMPV